MSSYQITTARSAFESAVADGRYRCAGCGGPIIKGAGCFTKPHFVKGEIVGQTRLHNLGECWESYDEAAINTLIQRRDSRG